MAITMPKILIQFKKLAQTLSVRSAMGTAVLMMRDSTSTAPVTVYTSASDAEADANKYTAVNMQYMQDAFAAGAYRVAAVRIGDDINDALTAILTNAVTGWITVCDGTESDFTALVTWIKAREAERKPLYNGLVFNAVSPDCKHVVNFSTTKVTFADDRGEVSGAAFLPSLAGILASCGVTSSCTYFKCTMLSAATATDPQNDALAAGKLFLFTDGNDIRIARGINSLTDTKTDEDFKFIDIVAVIDLIQADISNLWKETYAGKFRNILDNQMLFISAINSYFSELENEGVLDPEAANHAEIDVDAQRKAWIASGKSEAFTWTDEIVKVRTYRRDVYLTGSIRICGTMDNLLFPITLQ